MNRLTEWGERIDLDAPLPEHPRPQLVREGWASLNGPWQYAITKYRRRDPLKVADPAKPPKRWDGGIVVPFSPETPLSGVERTLQPNETLWYRRTFPLPGLGFGDEDRPYRVLLHFGAVDQSCRVAVNGIEVGGHSGGYLPFSLDITDAIGEASEQEIVVAVRDVTDASWLSRGKQSMRAGGIWYTPQSGIWQTVWIELVPEVAVDDLVLTPHLDLEAGDAELEVTVQSERAAHGDTALVTVLADGVEVGRTRAEVGTAARVPILAPRFWSPDDPYLYDVRVELGDDIAHSYTALRSFGTGTDARGNRCFTLNGEPHMPIGLLDQGYWPDGGYTAPSDEALEYDVRIAKQMGYSMLRKHIKIEPLRWYHHCDRLGMLVWQDHVSGGERYRFWTVTAPVILPALRFRDRAYRRFGRSSARGRRSSEAELVRMIELLRSVPSVSLWVPFNEGWGQFDAARIARRVSELDPTRPVDHASGWHDQGAGDVLSPHVYLREFRVPRRWRRDGRVIALSEYGGYGHRVKGHSGERMFKTYRRYETPAELEAAFVRLHEDQLVPAIGKGLAATVYTELSDVQEELNGVVTFDRRVVKVPVETVRAVNDRMRRAFEGDER